VEGRYDAARVWRQVVRHEGVGARHVSAAHPGKRHARGVIREGRGAAGGACVARLCGAVLQGSHECGTGRVFCPPVQPVEGSSPPKVVEGWCDV